MCPNRRCLHEIKPMHDAVRTPHSIKLPHLLVEDVAGLARVARLHRHALEHLRGSSERVSAYPPEQASRDVCAEQPAARLLQGETLARAAAARAHVWACMHVLHCVPEQPCTALQKESHPCTAAPGMGMQASS